MAGAQAGAFRIGDTAGTLDNIVHCKLHRPGSVGFVSKSGGMSNEMYNVLARASDGLYEGVPPSRWGTARHVLLWPWHQPSTASTHPCTGTQQWGSWRRA